MIPKFVNFAREKRVYRDIFGQKLRMEDVLLIHFEKRSVFLHISTQIQTPFNCFVKIIAYIRQISQIG